MRVRKLETRDDVLEMLEAMAGVPRSENIGPRTEALIRDILNGNPDLFGEDDSAAG